MNRCIVCQKEFNPIIPSQSCCKALCALKIKMKDERLDVLEECNRRLLKAQEGQRRRRYGKGWEDAKGNPVLEID